MAELGRLAEVGDTVAVDAGVFRVERMDGRRIDRIRFTPSPPVTGELPVQRPTGVEK
jgi:CBS domain containing-hemolysin-like protein